jgi:hypothetical protein
MTCGVPPEPTDEADRVWTAAELVDRLSLAGFSFCPGRTQNNFQGKHPFVK